MSNADMNQNEDDYDSVTERIIREIHEGIFVCAHFGMENVARTRFEAFWDALNGIRGKAPDTSIRERENVKERFDTLLKGKKRLLIKMNGLEENTRRILEDIQRLEKELDTSYDVEIVDEKGGGVILGHAIGVRPVSNHYDIVFYVCLHIYSVRPDEIPNGDEILIDGWTNMIITDDDRKIIGSLEDSYHTFKLCFYDRVAESVRRLTAEEKQRYGDRDI